MRYFDTEDQDLKDIAENIRFKLEEVLEWMQAYHEVSKLPKVLIYIHFTDDLTSKFVKMEEFE